jgi:hypothetical protein
MRLRPGMSRSTTMHDLGRAASIVVPAGVLTAAFVAALLVAGGARPGAVALLGLVYGGTVLAASGYLLIRWSIGTALPSMALTIVLGSVATSVALLFGCLLSGYRAGTIFVAWSLLVAAMAVRACRAPAAGLSVPADGASASTCRIRRPRLQSA